LLIHGQDVFGKVGSGIGVIECQRTDPPPVLPGPRFSFEASPLTQEEFLQPVTATHEVLVV
jgi:hypothetical protein